MPSKLWTAAVVGCIGVTLVAGGMIAVDALEQGVIVARPEGTAGSADTDLGQLVDGLDTREGRVAILCLSVLDRATGAGSDVAPQLDVVHAPPAGPATAIVSREEYSAWCTAAGDFVMVAGPGYQPATIRGDEASLGPTVVDVNPGGHTYLVGRVGSDVAQVAVVADGETFAASVARGWWLVAFPTVRDAEFDDMRAITILNSGARVVTTLSEIATE